MTDTMKILVIDDEEGVRDTICENLEVCGFEVIEAMDGEQGVQLIDPQDPPRVLITDIIMPRQEGLETIIKIRKSFPTVKVIAISGGGRTKTMDFLELAKKLGADAVLAKPLDIDELETTVRRLIG
jgi:DNA-binding response OmpR family regulator